MKALPADVKAYKRTPDFTRESTPPGLLRGHRTKAGVWGRIVVLEGAMTYRILEPAIEALQLDPGRPGVIEPGVIHEVVPLEGVRFYVEFLRAEDGTGGG
jgi:tellurite resistance-related uncharacterized protein